jgi:purine-binding chemotaxis protein CheW
LRRDFDNGFAAPARSDLEAGEDFLAVRMGDRRVAIRLSEVAALVVDKPVTRVPGAHPAMRGLAGFRGAIVPVYDLQRLLGHSADAASRWIVLAAAAPAAFSFEDYEGQRRIFADAFAAPAPEADSVPAASPFIRDDSVLRPVISLSSLIDGIGE